MEQALQLANKIPPIQVADTRDLTHEQWLRVRQMGLGGSDIAAVLGLNPWKSALSVYYDKVSEIEANEEENIAMELGTELEPFLRRKFTTWMKRQGHEIEVKENPYVLRHPEYEWMLANLDGEFEHPAKGLCGLELKTANEFAKADWEEDELPDQYYAQVQWYLAVTGLETFYIGYLIGNRKFDAKEIPRNDAVIEAMIEQASYFWHEHVLKQIPPAPAGLDCDSTVLKKMYEQEEPGKFVELHEEEHTNKYAEYKELNKQQKELELKIEAIKQHFMAQMQDSEIALVGKKKVTWKLVHRKGYTVEPTSYRSIRIY